MFQLKGHHQVEHKNKKYMCTACMILGSHNLKMCIDMWIWEEQA